jgi:ribose transport system permease protein
MSDRGVEDPGLPPAPGTTAAVPPGAIPLPRFPLPRISHGDIPLVMPYVYVVALGLAIYSLNSNLLVGTGAIDARFSLIVPLALVAFGQTLVMFTRGIDLSVGGLISMVSALLAAHLNEGGGLLVLELLGVAAVAVLIGALNGGLIAYTRLQPFIVTLATWSIWGGVAFAILPVEGGAPSSGLISAVLGNLVGVPKSVWAVALLFVLWNWLRPTRFITDLIAIGSDEERARLLGVHLVRRKLQAYAFSAVLAALASIWVTAQTEAGAPNGGDQFILSSVAAVVLGGTSIFGGKGSAASSIVGAIAFLMIPDLVFALNLTSFWSIFFQGFILIAAVTFNSIIQQRAGRQA